MAEEAKLLKQYLDLECIRFSRKFGFDVFIKDPETTGAVMIPALIVHPIVENALYHGVLNNDAGGHIEVTFPCEYPYLVCCIRDNGIGREAAAKLILQKGNSDVTPHHQLLLERISIINEDEPGRIAMEVKDLFDDAGMPAGTGTVPRFRMGKPAGVRRSEKALLTVKQ